MRRHNGQLELLALRGYRTSWADFTGSILGPEEKIGRARFTERFSDFHLAADGTFFPFNCRNRNRNTHTHTHPQSQGCLKKERLNQTKTRQR